MAVIASRPAAFLDRDGVLNHDSGWAHRPDHIVWVDGAKAAVRRLNRAGFLVFVVTNQAGIARGLYGETDVEALHAWMNAELAAAGARIDDFRFSPYHPEFQPARYVHLADWRKPSPGMLLDLMRHWPVRREGSFLVGDRDTDIEAAAAAGVRGHLFEGGDLDAYLVRLLSSSHAG